MTVLARAAAVCSLAVVTIACGQRDIPRAEPATAAATATPTALATTTPTTTATATPTATADPDPGVADDAFPGVTFGPLPEAGRWTYEPRTRHDDDLEATAGFATSVRVAVRDQPGIDQALAEQQALYDEHDYEVEDPWYAEVEVPGADRAVRYEYGSASGDGIVGVLIAEVRGIPVHVTTYLYIEDVDEVATDEDMVRLLDSVAIDPDELEAAIRPR